MEDFKETGHPVFRGISALNRGTEKKNEDVQVIHFTSESPNAELLFRTIQSANQFSIYGAGASWCEDLAQRIPGQTHVIMVTSLKGSKKKGSNMAKISHDVLLHIRAIPGHTGGNVIAPELMGHVAVPSRWKDFLLHRGLLF